MTQNLCYCYTSQIDHSVNFDFVKYHATGNDFILIDNRAGNYDTNRKFVSYLCHRRFGIGADGLILLNSSEKYDFEMLYFNSDGREATMCGNGGRCIVAFASYHNIINKTCIFSASDGIHKARILKRDQNITYVDLQMSDVKEIQKNKNNYILNTGSPHLVKFTNRVEQLDVLHNGRSIRYSDQFKEEGVNVNFVEVRPDNTLFVRTYERGVENETLSCGTGVVASAIAHAYRSATQIEEVNISTPGGMLNVKFKQQFNIFTDISLAGPATFVFEGTFIGIEKKQT